MSKNIAANAALYLNGREVTGVTAERAAFSGNVNRCVRAVLSGAFSSITYLVSWSRGYTWQRRTARTQSSNWTTPAVPCGTSRRTSSASRGSPALQTSTTSRAPAPHPGAATSAAWKALPSPPASSGTTPPQPAPGPSSAACAPPSATASFEFGPAGDDAGDVKISGECWLTRLSSPVDIGNATMLEAAFQVDGAVAVETF